MASSYEESYAKEEPPLLHPVPSMIHMPDAAISSSTSLESPDLRRRVVSQEEGPPEKAALKPDEELPIPQTYDADVLTKGMAGHRTNQRS